MDKSDFRNLFLKIAQESLRLAQQLTDRPLPSRFAVELHGGGVPGQIVALEDALSRMFVSETLFFGVIDIGLKRVEKDLCILFVRISDHPPDTFERTWNTPPGNGPFKAIVPAKVEFRD